MNETHRWNGRWFVSYRPHYCTQATHEIFEGHIDNIITKIEKYGTIIFFHELPRV